MTTNSPKRNPPLWRRLATALGVAVAVAALVYGVREHYPVHRWLFWQYVQAWLGALAFTAACVSAGYAVVDRLAPRWPVSERLLLSAATGLVAWYWAFFIGGLAGLLGPVLGVLVPLALAATGARRLWRLARRAVPHLRAARARSRPLSFGQVAALLLGTAGLLMVYVTILNPENAAHDARWYHLAIPEHYVAAGRIERFPEGWYQGALPQLASIVYMWPNQFGWLSLFDITIFAAHLEWIVFIWTLASIALLVRRLVPRAPLRVLWPAMFLFPALFVYDGILSLAADHIAAFFSIPIFIALRRTLRDTNLRNALVLAIPCAGAAVTKYQAAVVLVWPVGALVCVSLWRGGRALITDRSVRALGGGVTALAGFASLAAVLTAPHWLKNWIWYGDPLYPVLQNHLTLRPWSPDASHHYRTLVEALHLWRPTGSVSEKLLETLTVPFTFSFVHHDWPDFHGAWPVFGFLFTLTWPAMPFLAGARRLWHPFIATHVGIVAWFHLSHQDRYLQVLLPWMVVHVAAFAVLAWRSGWLVRVPWLVLITLQAVWGGAAYFIPSHRFVPERTTSLAKLLSSGYRRNRKEVRNPFEQFGGLREHVPEDGKVLMHRFETHAGLQRQSMTDHPAWQGYFSYGRYESTAQLVTDLRSMGVTHVAWVSDNWYGDDSIAGDLRFTDLVTSAVRDGKSSGAIRIATLREAIPTTDGPERVLYLGCRGYEPGLYHLSDMTVEGRSPSRPYPHPRKRVSDAASYRRAAASAKFLVWDRTCPASTKAPKAIRKPFARQGYRGKAELMARKPK